jgi:hypothetical protein
MDRETLRKQIYDEVRSEFDSKLKDARREKKLAEEELENSAERWRSERRRLNAEIDKLENALTDAKESQKRRGGSERASGMDPLEVAKMQAAADERLKKAAKEFDSERDRLNGEISRLEKDLADSIARSNNPLRTAMPVVQEYESRMKDMDRVKAELEGALSRARAEWEQEKLRLTSEMLKLRRVAEANPSVRGKIEADDNRIQDLEKQVQNLKTAAAGFESEKTRMAAVSQAAANEWEKERKRLTDHAGQLQQAFMETKARLESLEASAKAIDHDARMQEADRVKAMLEQDFQKAQIEWDRERRRMLAEIDQLRKSMRELTERSEKVSNDIVEQLQKQYDQKMQEMIQQKTKLTEELQNASELLEAERARFSAEISKSQAQAATAATATPAESPAVDSEAINAELQRVEGQIQEIAALIDDPATDLSTVIRKNVEKAELDAYLKGILFSFNRVKG